jgi:hypothetical protein
MYIRKRGFKSVRFALFARSYAGYYFTQQVKVSNDPNSLVRKLAKTLLFDEYILGFYLSPKFSKSDVDRIIKNIESDKEKIKIYLEIEKQLTILIQDKGEKESYVPDEYENALLAPAIERVAGDSVSNIQSDSLFEKKLVERKRIYTLWYYSIVRNYRLPTLRIIPFLARLIKIEDGKNYNTK